ncbi:MAG: hypothetical protein KFF73_05605 [Cyclobacteriaceae bacterium]|nr:hypothetical protein [Cyclobacteriaceae bacterium]
MKVSSLFFLIFFSYQSLAQEIVPRDRFGEIEIGITYEDVIWILGFDGSKMSRESAPEMLTAPLEELKIDFDFVINYRYIMDLPVTSVYIKDNLVVFFTISSYPEYNQFICQDLKTTVGLRFWDSLKKVKELYGQNPRQLKYNSGNLKYYAYDATGICFGIDHDEVRTISIFNQDF